MAARKVRGVLARVRTWKSSMMSSPSIGMASPILLVRVASEPRADRPQFLADGLREAFGGHAAGYGDEPGIPRVGVAVL